MKTQMGILLDPANAVVRFTPWRNMYLRSPMIAPSPPLKQREYPKANQMTVVTPIETKLWIMIASTFFLPTSPP